MEVDSTGTHPTLPAETNGSNIKPYITLIILVAGVVGGLVTVFTVILFCKFCVKKKSVLRRQPAIFSKCTSESYYNKPRKYRSLESSISVDVETGLQHDIFQSGKDSSASEGSDTPTHTPTLCQPSDIPEDDQAKHKSKIDITSEPTTAPITSAHRRVSFHLDNLVPASTRQWKGESYTEGDFHHLKHSKINKSSPIGILRRQASLLISQDSTTETMNDEQQDLEDKIIEMETITILDYSGSYQDSPSPIKLPQTTEVSVEVHRNPNGSTNIPSTEKKPPSCYQIKKHSQSLEIVTECESWVTQQRRSHSFEEGLHDLVLATQFTHPPVFPDGDTLEVDSLNKVHYNDPGSLEQVDDENIDMYDEEIEVMEDAESENAKVKYKELWQLRATLEEDEELSDTIRMEDMTSPEQSPEREQVTTSYTTSFESNTEPAEGGDQVDPDSDAKSSNWLFPPSYETRRQTYKSILSKRLKKLEPTTSTENSFDSVETVDTEGSSTDASRQDVITTSFESTTDNTDSTGDSQTHKLQQMKSDSGYKSMESTTKPPKLCKKQIHFAIDDDSIEVMEDTEALDKISSPTEPSSPVINQAKRERFRRNSHGSSTTFERRNGRTASKKRREYSRERQAAEALFDSFNELETDSKSDQQSADSFDKSQGKSSVFSRFFRSSKETRDRLFMRDYSIDEKSDALFKEFSRRDPAFEDTLTVRTRSPRLHPRHKLHHHRHIDTDTHTNGSSSPRRSKLSPQDSIEEEYLRIEVARTWEGLKTVEIPAPVQQQTIQEIPIIKLPGEDSSET